MSTNTLAHMPTDTAMIRDCDDHGDGGGDAARPAGSGAEHRLVHLLKLASPALPVGGFAYSQGLEAAVTAGLVSDEESAAAWLLGLLEDAVGTLDLPVLARLHAAWAASDRARVLRWGAYLLACRPTAELQAEDRHLGGALARVLAALDVAAQVDVDATEGGAGAATRDGRAAAWSRTLPFASAFACAAAAWNIPVGQALEAYAFVWAEAQTSAAVRLVPLGQTAGLHLAARAMRAIPAIARRAQSLADDQIGAAAPGQALLSAQHETQYSRLFRS